MQDKISFKMVCGFVALQDAEGIVASPQGRCTCCKQSRRHSFKTILHVPAFVLSCTSMILGEKKTLWCECRRIHSVAISPLSSVFVVVHCCVCLKLLAHSCMCTFRVSPENNQATNVSDCQETHPGTFQFCLTLHFSVSFMGLICVAVRLNQNRNRGQVCVRTLHLCNFAQGRGKPITQEAMPLSL